MHLEGQRILIIKPSSLGDIIHTLPLAHALKRNCPSCSLGWLVQQSFAPLLAADSSIDHIHPITIPSTSEPQAGSGVWLRAIHATLSSLKTLGQEFRQNPYTLVLDLHASFRSGLLGRCNPGGLRFGFREAKELNPLFQHRLVEVPSTVEHAQEKNLCFCKPLGINVLPEDFYLCTGTAAQEAAATFLHQQDLSCKPFLYANPAARWQTKFWPLEHWAILADRLNSLGLPLIFGGSPQDLPYIQNIADQMHSPAYIAAGVLNLPQSAALISQAALYVGLDSGPMHMAALAGVPVVALFGPTHPQRVGPYKVAHRIVRVEGLSCLECRKRRCEHLSCMRGISTDMVETAILSLLADLTS
jgi:heptosyltransferase I